MGWGSFTVRVKVNVVIQVSLPFPHFQQAPAVCLRTHTHTRTLTYFYRTPFFLDSKCLLIWACKTLRKADEAFWRKKMATIPLIHSEQHCGTVDIFLRFPMSHCTRADTVHLFEQPCLWLAVLFIAAIVTTACSFSLTHSCVKSLW